MNFPTLQVSNFFDNPDYILNYAKTLEYEKSDGAYPGKRTKPLHKINRDLFTDINNKIIRVLYPDWNVFNDIEYLVITQFHKITYDDIKHHTENKEHPGNGWIHNDHLSKFTSIIYLSPGKDNGTAIYSKKDGFTTVRDDHSVKQKYYLNNEVDLNYYLSKLNENINQYNIECVFNSAYNKMIGFDGANPHAAIHNLKPGEERITLISFFENIKAPYFHIPEMRRI